MSKVGRNEPCPCGSGRKAKRCCGIERGPSEESRARAFLAHASEAAAGELRDRPDEELPDLFEELWELPCVDLSLQVELPKILSPLLDRLCEAVEEDDPDPDLLEAATRSVDGPVERARLAHAAISRAEAGVIDGELAAAALLDLASDSRHLMNAALLEALAVRGGVVTTPAGLRLAA
ncbi:MAG: SEC-C domain-containing protein [Actinobacteria bacterium]|nr:SEC-C domain-containing protein [Actinomycetota bacterium]